MRARTLCQIAVGVVLAGALTACSSSVPGVAEASDLAAGIQSVVESASAGGPASGGRSGSRSAGSGDRRRDQYQHRA